MRILLVKPNYEDAVDVTPPLGLGYLASVLRQDSHDVRLLDNRLRDQGFLQYCEVLGSWRPDVIGISAVTYEAKNVERLIVEARRYLPGVNIIVGGPIAWAEPTDALFAGLVNYAIQGEGEMVFRKLICRLDAGESGDNLPSVVTWNGDGGPRINLPEEIIQNVDEIPFPAWDLFDMPGYHCSFRQGYVYKQRAYFPIFTSRGCPYECIYCHKIFGRRFRARSPENVVHEIELLVGRYRIREIHIVDDIFNLDMNRAETILREIIARKLNIALCFPNGVRGDLLDEHFIDLMVRAGTYRVSLAVETGSPKMQRLIKKNVDLDKIKQVIKLLADKRVLTNIYNMIGFPGETRQDAQMTARFAYYSQAHSASFFFVNPLPGTELGAMARKTKGAIVENVQKNYFDPQIANLRISEMTPEELKRILRHTAIWFYFGYPYRLWRIVRDLPRKRQLISLSLIITMRHFAPIILRWYNRLWRKKFS